jgi:hypothetical protein
VTAQLLWRFKQKKVSGGHEWGGCRQTFRASSLVAAKGEEVSFLSRNKLEAVVVDEAVAQEMPRSATFAGGEAPPLDEGATSKLLQHSPGSTH